MAYLWMPMRITINGLRSEAHNCIKQKALETPGPFALSGLSIIKRPVWNHLNHLLRL